MSNIIKNLKLFKIFKYDTKETLNINYVEKREQLYDDLIEEDYAYYICREIIDKKYIEDMFNHKNIKGIILLNKNTECIIGFMLFTIHKEYISLKLLGAIEDEDERMGVKIGTLFMEILEKYSLEKRIYKIKSEVVQEAIDFYTKCGYETLEHKSDMYYIEKNLKKEISYINDLFDREDDEYETESEEEEDIYNEVDLDSDMETEIDNEEYQLESTYEEEMFSENYELCSIS